MNGAGRPSERKSEEEHARRERKKCGAGSEEEHEGETREVTERSRDRGGRNGMWRKTKRGEVPGLCDSPRSGTTWTKRKHTRQSPGGAVVKKQVKYVWKANWRQDRGTRRIAGRWRKNLLRAVVKKESQRNAQSAARQTSGVKESKAGGGIPAAKRRQSLCQRSRRMPWYNKRTAT